ncbi:MAG: endopeptidase La [Gammaproteobacteria bacterium]|nr:endopeptidase La [Gammaproteobacteria bacterium]
MSDSPHADDEVIEHVRNTAAAVPARISETLPDRLLLLPLSERPFFPAQTMPIIINEAPWGETMQRLAATPHKLIGLVYAEGGRDAAPPAGNFALIGTVARVHHAVRGDGRIQFIAEGLHRFHITRWIATEPPYVAQVTYPSEPEQNPHEVRAYALAIINKIKELLPLNPLYKEHLKAFLERFRPEEASPLTDFAAALTSAASTELQEVLDTLPLLQRMEKTLLLVQRELEVTGLQSEIRRRVEERISTRQREFFLKEQLKEIQKELGLAKDDKTLELERLRERLAGLMLPAAARQRIDEEMDKISFLEVGSPEYAVTRNYLDALTALPWGKVSADNFDLAHARAVLDRDHDGLDDVKQRIIEFLAVGAQSGRIAGSIILLVGPPGTGKSSIGRSIATALGRTFYRFSVGGMRDEAEIKGHRRTYIGAMPGKFMQALRETGTSNPVIMLDEIDKIGASYHGDPAAALLEVLDPEQNADFLDHYLDVRFDLSKVLFICTANQLDTIPRPLLDRMEVIRLAGYVAAEKQRIAKRHLWPKQRAKAGLKAAQISLSDAALRTIIENYAREAGVRKLEMQLGAIARKAVVRLLDGAAAPIRIAPQDIGELLGPTPFRPRAIARGIGLANGLAWTPLGGVTLEIEATLVHRKGRSIKVTGQLGGVMRESAEIALSHVEANLERFHAPTDFFDQATVHLHVPEGATPKDGPSAGITLATALLSLALGQPIARPLAMTGELTLTGQVLAVGGIREKVVAARRIGIRELILPAASEADYAELPDYLRAGLKTNFVNRFEQVAALCFPGKGKRTARARRAR